ncbi:MAG TPA: histidine kinase [Casimicrobiaceae bacterium]|nr:histidine kinase [Casimicrobiaceae bacterium]
MTPSSASWLAALRNGLHVPWTTVLLIFAINTGVAGVMWIEDTRPFWHPFVSTQCFGFSIAYCVAVAAPWNKRWPVARLIGAVAVGAIIGMLLVIVVKRYTPAFIASDLRLFGLTMVTAFFNGVFVSLFFLLKFREARAESALLKAQSAQHLLSKQAAEAELKVMQAQVEPHFLFNTLASVQYLIETSPPQAAKLLSHLLAYLRAALPQLRTSSTELGKEVEMAEAYLNILKMRMGSRLEFAVDVPQSLRDAPFPPGLLISIVENAVEHGLESQAQGGTVAIAAKRVDDRLQVTVTDSGGGVASPGPKGSGRGIGLSNVRERLAALYGQRGRFSLENASPHGARAIIEIPAEA